MLSISIIDFFKKRENKLKALAFELMAKFLPFALIPFITNAFGPSKYTEYLFYESILFIFVMLFTFGQDSAISRSVLVHKKNNSINVQNTAYSITIFIGIFCSILAFSQEQYLVAFIALGAILIAICNMVSLVAIAKSDLKIFNRSRISNQILAFSLTIFCIVLSSLSIQLRIFFIIFGFLVGLMILSKYLVKFGFKNIFVKSSARSYLISIGFFLFSMGLSHVVRLRIDKVFFLDYMTNNIAANIALASIFLIAIAAFIDAVFKIFLPTIYRSFDVNKSSFMKNLFKLIMAGLLVILIGLFFYVLPNELYEIIFGEGFNLVGYYVFIMTIPYLLFPTYLYFVNYAVFLKKTKILALISVISTSIWIMFSFFILFSGFKPEYIYISHLFLYIPTIFIFFNLKLKTYE